MIQIAIISNPSKISGLLTKLFTGSYAYHVGFVDTEHGKFYDMNLLFRRRLWPHYPEHTVKFYRCPVEVTGEMLEHELDTSEDWYGVLDYFAFGFKKLFAGKRPSFKGETCSEKVEQILVKAGWESPFKGFTPSPADFEGVLEENLG